MTTTTTQRLAVLAGRLDGLAGTARYNLPDELRVELKEIATAVAEVASQRGH